MRSPTKQLPPPPDSIDIEMSLLIIDRSEHNVCLAEEVDYININKGSGSYPDDTAFVRCLEDPAYW